MNPNKALSARTLAAQAITPVFRDRESLNLHLPAALEQCETEHRPLLQELALGSIRWFHQLNSLLQPLLKKNFKPKDQVLFGVLLVAAYQLLKTEKPDYAVISSAVDSCQELDKAWAKNVINAVLRQLQRDWPTALSKLNPAQRYAHPKWLLRELEQAWPAQYLDVLAANNQRPPFCLRVNRLKQQRDDYLDLLQQSYPDADATRFASSGIRLPHSVNPAQLPGFTSGTISVQDEAAQLCAGLLHPQPGQRVLDACAAPGGKTCHLLEQQPELAELVALDNDPKRLQRVTENLQRLELNATLLCADATELHAWWNGNGFDHILLDAPCSGTGVIRRNPDIKLLRSADDIAKLVAIQHALLIQLWQTLKPGGQLLYATCSVLPAENSQQIAHFLQQQPDACLRPITAEWGLDTGFGRQLLPSTDGPDGFFYALLGKASEL